jgi:hypothetical protein
VIFRDILFILARSEFIIKHPYCILSTGIREPLALICTSSNAMNVTLEIEAKRSCISSLPGIIRVIKVTVM